MTIGEQMEQLRIQIKELNVRLFALEGKVTTFEQVTEQDREYRKEVHRQLLENQSETVKRVSRLELKLAAWGGALGLLAVLLKFLGK